MIHGNVNADEFVDFAWKHLADHVNPYPGPNSVLFIDNASIHHTEEWSEYVEEMELICIYLPEYCPWMNLCEWMFNGIKMREQSKGIKGEYEAMTSICESVEDMKGKNWSNALKRLKYIETDDELVG